MSLRGERRYVALLLLPYLLGLVVLVLLPGLMTFGLALYDYDLIRAPVFAGFSNFAGLVDDEIFQIALRNTLAFLALAVPLRLVAAVSLALLLHRPMTGAGAYRTAAFLPTALPDVAYALVWLWLFNPLYGPINVGLTAIGQAPPQWLNDPDAARWATVIMATFIVGESFVVAMAARNQIPRELYDLAEIEDAGPLNRLRRITLPLMGPTLLLLIFRDTIFSLQASFVPALLVTGGGPPPYATTYLPLLIYRDGFEYLRYGYAAATTVVMIGVTALIVLLQYLIVRRWRRALPL